LFSWGKGIFQAGRLVYVCIVIQFTNMKLRYSLFFSLSVLTLSASSQTLSLQSQKTTGGSGYDYIHMICPTADGGYVAAGSTESNDGDVTFNHGSGDCWIMRYNAGGNLVWQRSIGGSSYDYAYAVEQTNDGNFIIAGYTESTDGDITSFNHGSGDALLFKLDGSGNIMWQKCFGGSAMDNAFSLQECNDGSLVITGSSMSLDGDATLNHGSNDGWVIKTDASGNLLWQQSYGGSSADYFQHIRQTPDNGFILAGYTNSADGDVSSNHGGGDSWIVKTDAMGLIQWEYAFGGTLFDHAQSIELAPGGNYVATGYTESGDGDIANYHGNGDAWLATFDLAGTLIWERTLGSSENDYGYSINNTSDGKFSLAGYSGTNDGDVSQSNGDYDCWVVKVSADGSLSSEQSFGGSSADMAYSMVQSADGSLIIAGYTTSNDVNVSGNHGSGDAWIIKLAQSSVQVAAVSSIETIQVLYGPANSFTFNGDLQDKELIVNDLTGRIVHRSKLSGESFTMILSEFAKGLYAYKLFNNKGFQQCGKLVLQ
jgi:hypothetical protein